MKADEVRRLEMFRRVRDFGVTHADSFAAGSIARQLFNSVQTALDQLEDAGATQSAAGNAARQSTAGKDVARVELREIMSAMSRTALAMSYETPGIEERFRLPRKDNDQELLNTARAFFAEAAPMKAEFIKYEMPPDFLETLSQKIDNFERAILGQITGTKTRIEARATIDAAIEQGMEAVRRLSPIVRNKFRDDPATLAAWESASHVERAPRSKRTGDGNQHEENKNTPPQPQQ